MSSVWGRGSAFDQSTFQTSNSFAKSAGVEVKMSRGSSQGGTPCRRGLEVPQRRLVGPGCVGGSADGVRRFAGSQGRGLRGVSSLARPRRILGSPSRAPRFAGSALFCATFSRGTGARRRQLLGRVPVSPLWGPAGPSPRTWRVNRSSSGGRLRASPRSGYEALPRYFHLFAQSLWFQIFVHNLLFGAKSDLFKVKIQIGTR